MAIYIIQDLSFEKDTQQKINYLKSFLINDDTIIVCQNLFKDKNPTLKEILTLKDFIINTNTKWILMAKNNDLNIADHNISSLLNIKYLKNCKLINKVCLTPETDQELLEADFYISNYDVITTDAKKIENCNLLPKDGLAGVYVLNPTPTFLPNNFSQKIIQHIVNTKEDLQLLVDNTKKIEKDQIQLTINNDILKDQKTRLKLQELIKQNDIKGVKTQTINQKVVTNQEEIVNVQVLLEDFLELDNLRKKMLQKIRTSKNPKIAGKILNSVFEIQNKKLNS